MTDWEAIVREFGPVVWQTAFRLLDRDADAADCFQMTFLAAVELDSAQSIRNWPAMLKRIATARALEQLRVRYRSASRSVPIPQETLADPATPDPIERAAAGELAQGLREALTAIDPAQANVFCLICIEELSYRDAAEQLGITPNHAGVLLNRARNALRHRLAAFDPDPHRVTGDLP
jgi:RNA polymerase sigma-70 factor (ECF subfamily)